MFHYRKVHGYAHRTAHGGVYPLCHPNHHNMNSLTDRDRWVLELQKRGDLLWPSLTQKYHNALKLCTVLQKTLPSRGSLNNSKAECTHCLTCSHWGAQVPFSRSWPRTYGVPSWPNPFTESRFRSTHLQWNLECFGWFSRQPVPFPVPFPLAQNAPASASRSSKSLLNLGQKTSRRMWMSFSQGNWQRILQKTTKNW